MFSLFIVSINAQVALFYQLEKRYTNHTHSAINPYGLVTPTTPIADSYVSRFLEAGTYQNSTLTSTTMSGIGSTSGTQNSFLAGAFSTSYFDIIFSVDELTDFSLSGYLDANYDFGVLSVSLFENGMNIFSIDPLNSTSTGFIYCI